MQIMSEYRELLDEDYDLIVCVGYMMADAVRECSRALPDQKFAIIDMLLMQIWIM